VGNPLANACGSTPGRAIHCNLFWQLREPQPPKKDFRYYPYCGKYGVKIAETSQINIK